MKFREYLNEVKILSVKDIENHFKKSKDILEVMNADGKIFYIENTEAIYKDKVYGIDSDGEEHELKIKELQKNKG